MKRITILAAAGALACLAAVPAATSQAAPLKPAASPAGLFSTTSQSPQLAASANGIAGFKPVAPNPAIESAQVPRALTKDQSPGGPDPAAHATGAGAPTVSAADAARGRGSVVNAFDGLNNLTNDRLFGRGHPAGPGHVRRPRPHAQGRARLRVGSR